MNSLHYMRLRLNNPIRRFDLITEYKRLFVFRQLSPMGVWLGVWLTFCLMFGYLSQLIAAQ